VNTGATGPTGGGGGGGGGAYALEAAYTVPPTATGGYDSSVTALTGGTGDAWGPAGTTASQLLTMNTSSLGTSNVVSGVFKNISNGGAGGTGGFYLTCRFRTYLPPSGSGPEAFGIIASDGTNYYQFGFGTEGDGVGFVKITRTAAVNGTITHSTLAAFNGTSNIWAPAHFWLRYYDNTSTRNLQFSWDGNTWITLLQEGRTNFMTATKIGWGGNKNGVLFSTQYSWNLGECISFQYADLLIDQIPEGGD
jgi:hypothetical protein